MQAVRALVFVLVACRPSTDASRSLDSAATMAPSSAPSASSSAQTPDVDASKAQCDASGDFDLSALAADPACTIANDDPRAKALGEGNGRKGVLGIEFEAKPRSIHAKGGATFELELAIENKSSAVVELVMLVVPDEWFTMQAKKGDEWEGLPKAHAPGLPLKDARGGWFAAVRFAPKAIGRTKIAAHASQTRIEHLAPPADAPSTPAPYVFKEMPLAPGTYDLRFADRLAQPPFDHRPGRAPVKLVVDP